MSEAKEGYKGHRAGSAKGKVHQTFDEDGAEAAIKRAKKLGKAETTARTWVSEWKNAGPAKKKAKKDAAPAKKSAKKTSAKKKAPAKKPAVKRERITEARASA
jgi:hypothetical protein